MLTEDYVSYETAKLLKEKGFDAECDYLYVDGKLVRAQGCACNWNDGETLFADYKNECSAPTIQIVMKWLREVHHYYIQVMLDSWACGGHMGYYIVIQKTDSDFEMMLSDAVDEVFYQTYEEACEAGIKYCLENLI